MYKKILSIGFISFAFFALLFTLANAGFTVKRPTGVLQDGLVGHWTFDGPDISGTAVSDKSGQGNNGTMTGGPLKVVGKLGQGMKFDGNNDYVYVNDPGSSSLDITGQVTLSAWIKQNSQGTYKDVIEKGDDDNQNTNYALETYNDELLFFFSNPAGSNNAIVTTDANLQTGTWYHVAVAYNDAANNIDLYVNGVLRGKTVYMGNPENTSLLTNNRKLFIGWDSANSGEQWDGAIDDVRIYSRALSADEVKSLYNMGAGLRTSASQQNKITTGLVGYWTFNGPDISGTTAYDRSPVGTNHGTMVGGPLKVVGKLGQGLRFDGSNDYVDAGSDSSLSSENFTYSFWVKQNISNGEYRISNHGVNRAFTVYSDNLVRFGAEDTEAYISTTALKTAAWYHVAFTYDGTTGRLFINGTQEDSKESAIGDASASFVMGQCAHGGHQWPGDIDDYRIYNRALAADEIKALYNQGASKYHTSQQNQLTNGLVGYWPFNGPDISGSTAYDRSGQGSNGTIIGESPLTISIASDNFDRSNGTLGSNWSTVAGTSNPVIKSNKVNMEDETDGLHSAYCSANNFDSNQYAQAKFPNSPGSSYGPAIAVRLADSRGYILWWGNSSDIVSIWRMDNSSSWTELADSLSLTISNTDTWRLEAFGSSLKGYQNGNLVVQATDSTYAGGSPGMWLYYQSNQIDDWVGGNLTNNMVAGRIGQAMGFDRVDDYVDIGTPLALDLTSSMTVSAWVKAGGFNGVMGNDDNTIISKTDDMWTGDGGWVLYATTDNGPEQFAVAVSSNGSAIACRWSNTNPAIGTFYHVVGVYNAVAQTLDIYVNGVLDNGGLGGTVPSSQYNSSRKVLISARDNPSGVSALWNGTIDDVRVYDRALSAEEVKRLYNMGR